MNWKDAILVERAVFCVFGLVTPWQRILGLCHHFRPSKVGTSAVSLVSLSPLTDCAFCSLYYSHLQFLCPLTQTGKRLHAPASQCPNE